MRAHPILALLAFALAASAWADLPQPWLGTWDGDCTLTSSGQATRTFGMKLEVGPVDQGEGYTWRTTYELEGDAPQVRDYRLLPTQAPGHFIVDEQNGILIDAFLLGESVMVESFFIGSNGSLLNARWEVDGDTLGVEIPTFPTRPGRTTTGPGGIQVTAFSMSGVQRCSLDRQ